MEITEKDLEFPKGSLIKFTCEDGKERVGEVIGKGVFDLKVQSGSVTWYVPHSLAKAAGFKRSYLEG